ncbi:MAG: M56 family metallopeptidase [Acidimicrobiia bacterium]|nr:M56 family metallopeptidase [Acidimicrobiia bacterium]
MTDRVTPAQAARSLGVALTAVLAAAWATAWALTLAYIAHHPLIAGHFVWCRQLAGLHHPPPPLVGEISLVVTAASAGRLLQVILRWRRNRGTSKGEVHLIDSTEPVAFAEPGRRGGIIISSTILDVLRPTERQALLAHEQAHLRHRHDRYLLVATLARGLPVLTTLARKLSQALERWADEDAATTTGDRLIVARAVARAALATAEPTPNTTLAASGSNLPSRILALTDPPADNQLWTCPAVIVPIVVVLAALTQIHHLLPLIATLSRH